MRTIVIVGALLIAAGAAATRAQDLLSAAKDQYASAAYEDALSTLNRLDGVGRTGRRAPGRRVPRVLPVCARPHW